jgi:hypothetical protein
MELEIIILNGIYQVEKKEYHLISLIYGYEKFDLIEAWPSTNARYHRWV